MRTSITRQHGHGSTDAETEELMDEAEGLETDLNLERGTLVRELVTILRRRRQFEVLKRDFDYRVEGWVVDGPRQEDGRSWIESRGAHKGR